MPLKSQHLILIVLLVSSSVLFFRLQRNKLQSWDEAVYAESAKEMVQRGDWLTPHWNQEPFYQKPPLVIWAIALNFKIFGVSECSARAFSVLCGIACILLTFAIGRNFSTESRAGLAAAVLLMTPHFNYYTRQGSMDVPLTAFLLLSIYAYMKAKERTRWWIVVGFAMGLAVLAKGVAASPGLIALVVACVYRRERVWKVRDFWIGCAVCVLVAGSWHGAMLATHGRPFFSEYFVNQVLSRSSSSYFDAPPSYLYAYVITMFLGFLPFLPLLVLGVGAILKSRGFPVVLMAFGSSLFILYSLVATKHPWYLVPLYPILALLSVQGRIPRTAFAAMLIAAVFYSIMLDRSISGLHPDEPQIIAAARQSSGPIDVPINVAPAVLFYTDRKICTYAPDHSMGQLTRCGSNP